LHEISDKISSLTRYKTIIYNLIVYVGKGFLFKFSRELDILRLNYQSESYVDKSINLKLDIIQLINTEQGVLQ